MNEAGAWFCLSLSGLPVSSPGCGILGPTAEGKVLLLEKSPAKTRIGLDHPWISHHDLSGVTHPLVATPATGRGAGQMRINGS